MYACVQRDLSAPDALVERTFVEALYHKDARKRFMLRHCTPSAGRLATSAMLRGVGDPRWQVRLPAPLHGYVSKLNKNFTLLR